tara:strand:- start:240 stop:734 length:495 start_codon:yes stop_codon:yes gene_type:complete
MNRLEHVNLVVKDIGATLEFIKTAFPEWRVRAKGTNQWSGKQRNWLHVGDENYYITLNDGAEGDMRDLSGHAPGLAHLGFAVDDVDAIVSRLESKGFFARIKDTEHPFRKTYYYVDPAGFEFEFMQYLSDKDEQRNQYTSTGTTQVSSETVNPVNHQPGTYASC